MRDPCNPLLEGSQYRVHVVSNGLRVQRKHPPFEGHVVVFVPDEYADTRGEWKCRVIRELAKQNVPECHDPDQWKLLAIERMDDSQEPA